MGAQRVSQLSCRIWRVPHADLLTSFKREVRGQDRVRKGFLCGSQIPSVLSTHYTKVQHFGVAQAEVYFKAEDELGGGSVDNRNISQPTLWNFPSSLFTSGALESTTPNGFSLSFHRGEMEQDNGSTRIKDTLMHTVRGSPVQAALQQRVQGLTWRAVAIAGALFTECKVIVPGQSYCIICRAHGLVFKIIKHSQMVAEKYEA